MTETTNPFLKADQDKQRVGARVLGFFRGTKSARDLESAKGTSVVDPDLIQYINQDPDLTAAYDEGKASGADHMKKKKNTQVIINNS